MLDISGHLCHPGLGGYKSEVMRRPGPFNPLSAWRRLEKKRHKMCDDLYKSESSSMKKLTNYRVLFLFFSHHYFTNFLHW